MVIRAVTNPTKANPAGNGKGFRPRGMVKPNRMVMPRPTAGGGKDKG